MATTPTPATITADLVALYEAVFGAPPPDVLYNAVTVFLGTPMGANVVSLMNQVVDGSLRGLSDADMATLVLNNTLGSSPLNNAALHNALTDLLGANHANRGVVISQLTDALAHMEADPTYGAAAQAWNARVTAALTHFNPSTPATMHQALVHPVDVMLTGTAGATAAAHAFS